jgi:hypothetical protein
MRFCSDACCRSLMTVPELNQAIELEIRQDQEGLTELIDLVSRRAREKWLQHFPSAIRAKWNVRDTNSQSHA